MEKRFKVGDIIYHKHFPEIEREIIEVLKKGYAWKYPEHGEILPSGDENYFLSVNSTDPELDGYTIIKEA